MKHIKGYKSFNQVNEEFVFSAIKGALGKVMQAFSNTFKDFKDDFKKMFKEDDPNSIKGIIMTNFNQAIDGAQKMLSSKEVDENGINNLMNTIIDELFKLGEGLDKDVDTALGKDKSAGAKAVAKAILLGNKEAQWAGIVGLLDPARGKSGIKTNYKYSKAAYETALTTAGKAGGANALKARKDAATKFFDNMQKDIVNQLNKEFSEEEVKKIYDDTMDKSGQKSGGKTIILDWGDVDIELTDMTEDETKKVYKGESGFKIIKSGSKKIMDNDYVKISGKAKKGDRVKMTEIIRNGAPTKIDGNDFYETGALVEIKEDGKVVDEVTFLDTTNDDAKKAAESLGKIKQDPEKMKKVATFSDFLQDEKNKDKIAEIEKIMAGEGGA
jgi:hypothetical protein